jgi:hypothetical protein
MFFHLPSYLEFFISGALGSVDAVFSGMNPVLPLGRVRLILLFELA